MAQRIPPRDFFPRLPCVLQAIQHWVARNVHPSQTVFTFQTQSLFDAHREGIPHFIYTDHTYLANRRYQEPRRMLSVSKRWRQMEKELYQKATLSFTFSEFAANSIQQDYAIPPAQIQCVYSGANVRFPVSVNTSQRRGRKILFVGVDWERKGGPDLLAAFSLVRREIFDAELMIVGCLPEISSEGVTVVGRVHLEELHSYYEMADIFCLPSRVDPSASVLIEAAVYALPVVATTVGGNKERVIEGETGFLVPPGSIPLLAQRLCRLLQESNLRIEMGNNGRKRAMDLFHWPKVVDQISSTIEEKIHATTKDRSAF